VPWTNVHTNLSRRVRQLRPDPRGSNAVAVPFGLGEWCDLRRERAAIRFRLELPPGRRSRLRFLKQLLKSTDGAITELDNRPNPTVAISQPTPIDVLVDQLEQS
jgi:hypothetical protein